MLYRAACIPDRLKNVPTNDLVVNDMFQSRDWRTTLSGGRSSPIAVWWHGIQAEDGSDASVTAQIHEADAMDAS
jgi:hypothetical protein